jgi:hypothetical protein
MAVASFVLTIGSLWFFVVIAAALQDSLITGDGRSWIRALRYASVPAGMGLALAMFLAVMAVRARVYVLGGIAIGSIGGSAMLIGFACWYG